MRCSGLPLNFALAIKPTFLASLWLNISYLGLCNNPRPPPGAPFPQPPSPPPEAAAGQARGAAKDGGGGASGCPASTWGALDLEQRLQWGGAAGSAASGRVDGGSGVLAARAAGSRWSRAAGGGFCGGWCARSGASPPRLFGVRACLVGWCYPGTPAPDRRCRWWRGFSSGEILDNSCHEFINTIQ